MKRTIFQFAKGCQVQFQPHCRQPLTLKKNKQSQQNYQDVRVTSLDSQSKAKKSISTCLILLHDSPQPFAQCVFADIFYLYAIIRIWSCPICFCFLWTGNCQDLLQLQVTESSRIAVSESDLKTARHSDTFKSGWMMLNGQSSQPRFEYSASIWIWIVKHRACMSGTRSRWSARLQPRVSASPSHCIYIHLDLHPTAPSDHAIEWHNQTGHDCSNNDRPHRQRQGNQLCKVWHDCSESLASLPKDGPASFATLHDMVLCVCAAKTREQILKHMYENNQLK